jgi:hypothetical protein
MRMAGSMTGRMWTYGVTVFWGATLLFAVEPMAAKELLPVLGGSSAVWLACLCFFQTTLLLGYLYAHWLSGLGARRARVVHAVLLVVGAAALWWPGMVRISGATRQPAVAIFVALGTGIGLPFLLLSATGPLLQAWMARERGGRVPYRMFALSNVGSLLALVSYPVLVEPVLNLPVQRAWWGAGFALYAGLCGWLGWTVGSASEPVRGGVLEGKLDGVLENREEGVLEEGEDKEGELAVGVSRRWLWVALSAVGSLQMCAVTSHLTQNVAAMPLLWVLPLAVYLLSFVLAFEFKRLYHRGLVVRLLVVMLASLGYLLSKTDVSLPISLSILFFLLELLVACWFCHAELRALRPDGAREATWFYLLIAAGGAVGTIFAAAVSPIAFRSNYDLPISFALTAAVALWVTWGEGWGQRLLWSVSMVLGMALILMLHAGYTRDTMVNLRNFYGTLRVKQGYTPPQAGTARVLLNGSIEHGSQWFAEGMRRVPTTYYAPDSGVGLAMELCCEGRGRTVGVIGLGAGTMAAYGRAGDRMRFYEINPMVERVARELFTYERESGAALTVVDGDARLSLAAEGAQGFDVLVVDAFSGDAIPVHLLTKEAMDLYRRHMAPGGVIAFHISNQYLDLAPVVGRLAEAEGMEARMVLTGAKEERGEYSARWVLVGSVGTPMFADRRFTWVAEGIAERDGLRVWTDGYSSLLPIVRWTHAH